MKTVVEWFHRKNDCLPEELNGVWEFYWRKKITYYRQCNSEGKENRLCESQNWVLKIAIIKVHYQTWTQPKKSLKKNYSISKYSKLTRSPSADIVRANTDNMSAKYFCNNKERKTS
jgi:hypothetical protein